MILQMPPGREGPERDARDLKDEKDQADTAMNKRARLLALRSLRSLRSFCPVDVALDGSEAGRYSITGAGGNKGMAKSWLAKK
jgi:hypothetical protein